MSSEDLPEEENGYSLKGSTSLVGQLYPILRAKDGEILDGIHRSDADASWRSEVLENIDSEEKKLAARLIANFHRRRVPREEKAAWINRLAALYQSQGLSVEGKREKAQGKNEIVDRIVEVTGLNWRTVHSYLEPQFKQNSHARNDHSQHKIRSKASEILFNALAGRSAAWAKSVLERYQEELLQSPIFRARVITMLPLGFFNKKPGGRIKGRGYHHARKTSEKNPGNTYLIDMDEYYKIFMEECPQCICGTCPHAETCIERVIPDE